MELVVVVVVGGSSSGNLPFRTPEPYLPFSTSTTTCHSEPKTEQQTQAKLNFTSQPTKLHFRPTRLTGRAFLLSARRSPSRQQRLHADGILALARASFQAAATAGPPAASASASVTKANARSSLVSRPRPWRSSAAAHGSIARRSAAEIKGVVGRGDSGF